MPTVSAIGRPIADHSEKRPPTHSQNSSWLQGWMPHSLIFSGLADTPTKWQRISARCWSGKARSSQARAVSALARVSRVVKDFDDTTTRVVAGLRSLSSGAIWLPSMDDTKCRLGRRPCSGRKSASA